MAEIKELESVERQEEIKVRKQAGVERREEVVRDIGAERRRTILRVTNLIWLFAGITEALIGMRVLLKLIAANPANDFARFVYALTEFFVGPFLTLTESPKFRDAILEIPSLFAMLVYGLVAWAAARLIWVLFERSRARSVSLYERAQR